MLTCEKLCGPSSLGLLPFLLSYNPRLRAFRCRCVCAGSSSVGAVPCRRASTGCGCRRTSPFLTGSWTRKTTSGSTPSLRTSTSWRPSCATRPPALSGLLTSFGTGIAESTGRLIKVNLLRFQLHHRTMTSLHTHTHSHT